jgi:hypothetical protein
MPSTFTTNKNIEQPASGSYNNAWAAPVNADWTDIDNALAGTAVISVTGASGTNALVIAQYQPPNIEFTGTLTAAVVYALPATVGWLGTVYNNTSGAFTLTFSSSGGGSIVCPQGVRTLIVVDASGAVAQADSGTLAAAEAFAAAAAATAQSNAESFATAAANTAQSNAETFATAAANTAQTNAENFTSASYAPLASPALTGTPTVNGASILSSGTFTATLSGMSSGGTGTINYERSGKQCTLTALSAVTGTSNSNVCALSGLPAAATPSSGNPIVLSIFEDNSTAQRTAACFVLNTGSITFELLILLNSSWVGPNAAVMTASGTKGLPAGWTITYSVD